MGDEHPDGRPDTAEARKEAKRREAEAGREDPAPELGFDDAHRSEDPAKPGRLYRFGRRLLDRGDDVRELASAVIESSDRAKTEMVKMVAREVRTYLDELKLKEDVRDLMTKHSLEMHVSFSLKPLVETKDEPAKAAPAPTGGTPATRAGTKSDGNG